MLLLPFTSSLIPSILDGSKTSTYRFGFKYDHLHVGETIDIVDSDLNEIVAQANVTSKERVLFQDIPLISSGHRGFTSREEMRDHFSKLYSYIGRAVEDSDLFLVIGFELKDDEDREMITSPNYKQQIAESRKSGTIPADQVW